MVLSASSSCFNFGVNNLITCIQLKLIQMRKTKYVKAKWPLPSFFGVGAAVPLRSPSFGLCPLASSFWWCCLPRPPLGVLHAPSAVWVLLFPPPPPLVVLSSSSSSGWLLLLLRCGCSARHSQKEGKIEQNCKHSKMKRNRHTLKRNENNDLKEKDFLTRNKREQRQCSRNEKRCTQPCSMQPAFTAKWKEWKDCDELKPKPKERLIFREPETRGNEASNGKEEYRRLWNEFEMEGFVAQKGLWNLARENVLQDRGRR